MIDFGATHVATSECLKRKGGRPRCPVSAEQVRQLYDKGMNWPRIARTLEIGITTARRLYASRPAKTRPNLGSGETDVPHRPEHAQPSGARERVDEVREGRAPAPATQSAPRVAPIILRRIVPKSPPVGDTRPVTDKPPGRCEKCGSSVWRRMADDTLVCAVCHPLNG